MKDTKIQDNIITADISLQDSVDDYREHNEGGWGV